jgi:hypothetical protein
MGHQESFVYCDDFDYLVNTVNKLGKEFFDNRFIDVVEVVTLDRDIKFDLAEMCLPRAKRELKAGTKLLWVSGDRSYQHCLSGERGMFENHLDDSKKVEFYYVECFRNILFDDEGNWLFKWENFKYDNEKE